MTNEEVAVDYKTVAFDFKAKHRHGRRRREEKKGDFIGYAATFGNIDLTGDRIEKGAFKRTINSSKGRVPVLYQHREPIGQGITAVEDSKGLLVEGELFLEDEFPEARKAHKLVERGMIKSLSIGFEVLRQEFVKEKGDLIRVLKEIKLREYSLVLFPANNEARLTGMKNEDMQTVKDILAHYDPDQQSEFLKAALSEVDVYDSDSYDHFENASDSVSDGINQFASNAKELGTNIADFVSKIRKNRS